MKRFILTFLLTFSYAISMGQQPTEIKFTTTDKNTYSGVTSQRTQDLKYYTIGGSEINHVPSVHPIYKYDIHMSYKNCTGWNYKNGKWLGYWDCVHNQTAEDVSKYISKTQPYTDLIYVATDEFYIYTIVRDVWEPRTYFQISDDRDNILVKTEVDKKYKTIFLDSDGIWLFKKSNKSAILFKFIEGKLYRYDEN